MKAHYHHKSEWVSGTLLVNGDRITFKADVPSKLRQDASVRTTGVIEEQCFSFEPASPGMSRSYRSPSGTDVVFLRIGRVAAKRSAAFAMSKADVIGLVGE
jgi:hypothetical protein